MTNVCYILSNIDKAIAFEWIVDQLANDFQISFIILNPGKSKLETFLGKKGIFYRFIQFRGRGDFPKTFYNIYHYLKRSKPDVIHCHLFKASLVGLFAGKLAGVKKRIHTRHHSTFNQQYNQKGVWIDKLINYFSTDIIAISKNVRNVLEQDEQVPGKKVHLIHHGFDLQSFENVKSNEVEILKSKYKISGSPVVGVIARWIEWKGIQYIIPAFKMLLADYPNALLILANANGPYKPEIEKLLSQLPEESYKTIPFENDLFALYQLFDVYVHVPINPTIEAFGQTYVEALAAGIPSVFTLSGVAPEFIEHEKNALVVPFEDSEAIYQAMHRILKDKILSSSLIKYGKESIQQFSLQSMITKLKKLYL